MKVGTRAEWLEASKALLREEKELTRRSDELARRRRELPWVPVEKEYRFDTTEGTRTLAELFAGRSQLMVDHLMFAPNWTEACAGCSYTADSLDRAHVHLETHGVSFAAVSRAPLERIEAYKARMGWTFTWVSSLHSDFDRDFGVFTEEERRTGTGWNFGSPGGAGIDLREQELQGLSAFALADGVVYHTYSAYDRGTDALNATWALLDRSPLGRGETPEGWPRRRYEYGDDG